MGRVENRRMDWGKHKDVKLVHEVKMEVYSRDAARHTEKSDKRVSEFSVSMLRRTCKDD